MMTQCSWKPTQFAKLQKRAPGGAWKTWKSFFPSKNIFYCRISSLLAEPYHQWSAYCHIQHGCCVEYVNPNLKSQCIAPWPTCIPRIPPASRCLCLRCLRESPAATASRGFNDGRLRRRTDEMGRCTVIWIAPNACSMSTVPFTSDGCSVYTYVTLSHTSCLSHMHLSAYMLKLHYYSHLPLLGFHRIFFTVKCAEILFYVGLLY